jgi:hypothetical protein
MQPNATKCSQWTGSAHETTDGSSTGGQALNSSPQGRYSAWRGRADCIRLGASLPPRSPAPPLGQLRTDGSSDSFPQRTATPRNEMQPNAARGPAQRTRQLMIRSGGQAPSAIIQQIVQLHLRMRRSPSESEPSSVALFCAKRRDHACLDLTQTWMGCFELASVANKAGRPH